MKVNPWSSSCNIYHPSQPFLPPPQPNPSTITTARARARARARASSSSSKSEQIEIRVCTNRTCRRQGSLETLQVLVGIAPPGVSVLSCGCLGRCGSGPNLVVLPDALFVQHCGTPAKAAQTMSFLCLGDGDGDAVAESNKSLEALALRKRAQDEMAHRNFSESHLLLSQAIDLQPFGGLHMTYTERSAANLAMGNTVESLQDANEALIFAPKYPKAYICRGDALLAIDEIDAAERSYSMALELDPSIRCSKSFQVRIAKLREKLIPAN